MHRRPLLALPALLLAGRAAAQAPGPMPVVASFSILGDMTARIGGERIALRVIAGAGRGFPRASSRSPRTSRRCATRVVIIRNGLGFDGWMDRLVRSAGFRGPVATATEGITPRSHGRAFPRPFPWRGRATAVAQRRPAHACPTRMRGRTFGSARPTCATSPPRWPPPTRPGRTPIRRNADAFSARLVDAGRLGARRRSRPYPRRAARWSRATTPSAISAPPTASSSWRRKASRPRVSPRRRRWRG